MNRLPSQAQEESGQKVRPVADPVVLEQKKAGPFGPAFVQAVSSVDQGGPIRQKLLDPVTGTACGFAWLGATVHGPLTDGDTSSVPVPFQ